jgi:hypothetical protein
MAHPADESPADGPGSRPPGQPTRRPGAPRRSDEKLKDHNKCTEEGIKLIRALEAIIDARHRTRRELVEDLKLRFGVTISEKTLSNQLGGDRHPLGPDWPITRLIVVSCVQPERRILELARLAGLWAHARSEPRPAGYGGAIFPAVTAADQFEHVQALVAGFPGAPHVRCPGFERVNRLRSRLRFLLTLTVPWLSAVLVFHAAITARMTVLLTMADGVIIGLGIALQALAFLPVGPDFGMHLVEPRRPARDPATFEMVPGSEITLEGPFFRHWTPTTAVAPRPTAWPWHANDLEWTLQARETIVAPLGPRRPEWWISLREALNPELHACTEGGLMLIDRPGQQPDGGNEQEPPPERRDTACQPDAAENRSEPHPLVEWAILDWTGTLYATGLLAPRPVWKVPAAIPGVGAGTIVCGDGDEELPLPTYLVKLGGFARVPWPGHITILLRRIDTLNRPVRVKWEKAGVHVHAFTVHG